MERVDRLVNKHKYSKSILEKSDLVRGIWPRVVGPAIARHTGHVNLVRDTLVVDVDDAIWQKQLFRLSAQIIDRLQKCMGSPEIQKIEFRIAVRKREPQRVFALRPESESGPLDPDDESDLITDPVLKKVYRLSRKRSTA